MMQDTLQSLQQEYKSCRRAVLGYLPFLALSALSLWVNRYLAFGLLGGAVLYQLLYLRKKQKQYLKRMERANIQATVCTKLKVLGPAENGGRITQKVLREAQLMPVDDRENANLLCQGIGADLENGLRLDLCDATIAQDLVLVKNGKRRVCFNSGCWLRYQLPEDTGCNWWLLDRDSIPTPIRIKFFSGHEEVMSVELPQDMENQFVCYTNIDNPQPPSKAMLQQIRLLAAYTPGKLAVSLQKSTFTVFLRGRFLARTVSMAQPPSKEQLEFDPLPELEYTTRMAHVACQKNK